MKSVIQSFAVAGLLLQGCAAADEAASPVVARAATDDALRSEAQPKRALVLGGERVRRVAQWPSDEAIDDDLVAMMSAQARSALDTLPLPALVSSREGFARSTTIMPGARWYATWARHEDLTVTLNASGEAKVYPHVRGGFTGNERVREREAFVTQNEGIWSVTWIENGVAYDLGLECESPTMPQCQDGAFAMELVEDLRYVGPREGAR